MSALVVAGRAAAKMKESMVKAGEEEEEDEAGELDVVDDENRWSAQKRQDGRLLNEAGVSVMFAVCECSPRS